jgi:hypothetical protein
MKTHAILSTLAALACTAVAESPTGFLDIPFGAPVQAAQTAMAARPGVKPDAVKAELLSFTGGTFAEHPAKDWTLTFSGGKFTSGKVVIDNVKKPVYDELKAQLAKKYGKPDSEKGHHSFECVWDFKGEGRRTVTLVYEFKGSVELTYTHVSLQKAAPPAKKTDI